MNSIYYAHSGLRYLVLLSGVIALVVLLRGLLTGAAYGKASRISAASFMGFTQLQALLGVVVVLTRPWYAALIGHLAMMIVAIAAGQTLTSWAKRASDPKQAHRLAVAGVVVTLALMVAGIYAIGRHPFESQALGPRG
jgi:hypothetical protein